VFMGPTVTFPPARLTGSAGDFQQDHGPTSLMTRAVSWRDVSPTSLWSGAWAVAGAGECFGFCDGDGGGAGGGVVAEVCAVA
jgi:hypothetical protein